ncbi:GNAT family N-acetyltransferase [Streptomyces sp. NPDC088725]|uniref:GNAT family N-acetyltransferase n=1 Tax=Streptomyces sp. NPDC088725 TaxID=3365873 RepID=UPI0037F37E20
MAEVFIRRLSRWQAEQQREAVADVYVEAYRRIYGEEFRDRAAFLETFAEDVRRPGFDMVVGGAAGGSAAAYGYGFLLDRDGEWWRGLRQDVPWDAEELTVAGRVFVIAELMVLPAFRRGAVATRLVERLLARANAALVTVRVDPANEPAVAVLRSWGWTRLGELSVPVAGLPGVAAGTGSGVGVAPGAASDIWSRVLTS